MTSGMVMLGLLATAGANTVWLDTLDLTKAKQGWGKPQANLSVDGHSANVRSHGAVLIRLADVRYSGS